MKDPDAPENIERLFLRGISVNEICKQLNMDSKIVEDALRDQLRGWRFKARTKRAIVAASEGK